MCGVPRKRVNEVMSHEALRLVATSPFRNNNGRFSFLLSQSESIQCTCISQEETCEFGV